MSRQFLSPYSPWGNWMVPSARVGHPARPTGIRKQGIAPQVQFRESGQSWDSGAKGSWVFSISGHGSGLSALSSSFPFIRRPWRQRDGCSSIVIRMAVAPYIEVGAGNGITLETRVLKRVALPVLHPKNGVVNSDIIEMRGGY